MARILGELRRLGRLDRSLVIFHSDHGFHTLLAGEPALAHELPQEIVAKVEKWIEYTDGVGFLRRMHSLLMLKPPGAMAEPLRVSQSPTQLADIPATVYEVLGVAGDAGAGRSVFGVGEEEEGREIHYFFASHDTRTGLQHISHTWSDGWRVYPEIARN